MNKITMTVVTTCLMAVAGSAFAQGKVTSAEEAQRNLEMMKPPTMASPHAEHTTPTPAPMSAADKKAEEFRKSTEMMKPQTQTYASGVASHPMPEVTTMSEADRKVAEAIKRTEMMKPD